MNYFDSLNVHVNSICQTKWAGL